MNLPELTKAVAACRECSLRKRCRQVAPGVGNPGARVMVVGQAPGIEEGNTGVQFVGQAGEFLTTHLERIFTPTDLFYTTTVKCFPGRTQEGNTPPPAYALDACRKWMDAEVGLVNPQVIIAVGAFAMRYFGIKGGVNQNAGKTFISQEYGIPVVPVVDPAGLMRPKKRPEDVLGFVTQLQAARRVLDGAEPEAPLDALTSTESFYGYDLETEDGRVWSVGLSDGVTRVADRVADYVRPLDGGVPIMHNAKFDLLWGETIGHKFDRFEDTILLAHLLGKRPLNLKDLSAIHLGGEYAKFKEVVKKGVKMDDITDAVLDYNARDAWASRKLFDIFHPEVVRRGWEHVYEFDKQFSRVLMDMEKRGMPVAEDRMKAWRGELDKDMLVAQAILADEGIVNPSQNEVIARKFWQGKAKVVTTRTGLSTAADDLDEHALPEQRRWVDALLKWRQNGKFISTYLDNWITLAREGGWLHPQFKQIGTVTGRLSCEDPNLMNVTKSQLFQMFVAPEGYSFVSCDYSQIELRLLGNVSGDRALIEAYLAGSDMHTLTAALPQVQRAAKRLYEYTTKQEPLEEFTRTLAKRVNFGIAYGVTAYGLARLLGCTEDEAQAIIDAFYAKFPDVAGWQEAQRKFARQNGYVPTWYGRPLWVPGMAVGRGMLRHRADKQCSNYPIQGGAAEIVKQAMIRCSEYLICQVHDEVLYLVPNSKLADYGQFLKENLVDRQHEIPYTTSYKVGKTWGDLKKIPEFDMSLLAE